MVLTFDEPVNIVDGNGSDGWHAILINDGGAVTIDNANYAASSVTSLTLNFSGDEIASTSISGLSVTYEDAEAILHQMRVMKWLMEMLQSLTSMLPYRRY